MKNTVYCLAALAFLLSCKAGPGEAAPAGLWPEALAFMGANPAAEAGGLYRYHNESVEAADYLNYVILRHSLETYDGGAHGMHTTEYRVFDRGAGRFLTLGDIVSNEDRPRLREAVESALRKKHRIPEGSPLTSAGFFEDRIELSENFFLGEAGIGFHWNPYEIAPFSMGQIEVIVPLE
jgi:hypothetical protein